MNVITRCGWCAKRLDDLSDSVLEADESQYPVSHGICPDCQDNFEFQMGVDLHRFLDSLKVPVVVVNQTGAIQTANETMRSILGKNLSEIEGYQGGNVFECAHARLPEGCGNTIHCSGCTIRRAVMRTFASGVSETRTPATLIRSNDGSPNRFELLISTEKVGNKVLLQIVSMCPE